MSAWGDTNISPGRSDHLNWVKIMELNSAFRIHLINKNLDEITLGRLSPYPAAAWCVLAHSLITLFMTIHCCLSLFKILCGGSGEIIVMQHPREVLVPESTMQRSPLWYTVSFLLLSMHPHSAVQPNSQADTDAFTIPAETEFLQNLHTTTLSKVHTKIGTSTDLPSPDRKYCQKHLLLRFVCTLISTRAPLFSQKLLKTCSLHFQDFRPCVWKTAISLNYNDSFNICLLKIQQRDDVKTQ